MCMLSLRELMESLVPEVSRVCLDRRETKVPEASQDPLVPSACRLIPFTHPVQWRINYVVFLFVSHRINRKTVPLWWLSFAVVLHS